MREKLIPAECTDMISFLKWAVCIDHENLQKFAASLLEVPSTIKLGDAIMDDYNGMSKFSQYYCLIVHATVHVMDETFKQEFKCNVGISWLSSGHSVEANHDSIEQSVAKNERGIIACINGVCISYT